MELNEQDFEEITQTLNYYLSVLLKKQKPFSPESSRHWIKEFNSYKKNLETILNLYFSKSAKNNLEIQDVMGLYQDIDTTITMIDKITRRHENYYNDALEEKEEQTLVDLWLSRNYKNIDNVKSKLLKKGLIEKKGDFYNWTETQALLAAMLREYCGGYKKGIEDCFLIKNKPIKTLKAEFNKNTIPKHWERIEQIFQDKD